MINKENKVDVIISSISGFIYALIFSLLFIEYNSCSSWEYYYFLKIIITSFLGMIVTGLIGTNIKSKREKYFVKNLIKKIIICFFLGWIIWPGFGVFIAPFVGFYLASKRKVDKDNFSFQKYAWNQFKKNKIAVVSLYLLGSLILIARFAPYIANNQPLYAVYKGEVMYPAFSDINTTKEITDPETGKVEELQFDITDWRELELDNVIFAPIPYSPSFLDRYNRDYVAPGGKQRFKNKDGEIIESPSKFRHLLGTDGKGADLASGLIHGTKISLKIGLISMGIAAFIGIILGAFAGFFGDRDLKMRRIKYYMTYLGIFFGWFYIYRAGNIILRYAINTSCPDDALIQALINLVMFFLIIFVFRLSSKLITNKWFNKEINVPLDSIISRGIEILNSIPRLILIITLSAIYAPSLELVMIIIGVTGWTRIARFTRAELLRIKSLEFVQASKSLGFSSVRTVFKHALPNALAPVFVSIAFGIASAILIESGLSFLGIGVPDDVVTWGSLLNLGRHNLEAWWLILFPGIAIFITITIYNMIAEASRDALDPRLKS